MHIAMRRLARKRGVPGATLDSPWGFKQIQLPISTEQFGVSVAWSSSLLPRRWDDDRTRAKMASWKMDFPRILDVFPDPSSFLRWDHYKNGIVIEISPLGVPGCGFFVWFWVFSWCEGRTRAVVTAVLTELLSFGVSIKDIYGNGLSCPYKITKFIYQKILCTHAFPCSYTYVTCWWKQHSQGITFCTA